MPGKPIHQGRPRARVQGKGEKAWVQFYEPKESQDYQDRVAQTVHDQVIRTPVEEIGGGGDFKLPLADCRVSMSVRCNFEKPASYPKRVVDHTKKPDLDNLVKSIIDGVVKGNIIKDDNCITDLFVCKRYVAPDHPEGVEIDMTVIPCEI